MGYEILYVKPVTVPGLNIACPGVWASVIWGKKFHIWENQETIIWQFLFQMVAL